MAAETLTGARAASTFPAQGSGWASSLVSCWGTYAIAANVEDGDIFELCKTPSTGAGFLLLGGWLSSADIDTGTEALDMDLGWAANGSSAAATMTMPWGTSFSDSGYTASPTGLGNFGVWSGDAITDLMAAGSVYRPIILPVPLWFAIPTKIQVEANTPANAFTAGSVTVTLLGHVL
jgi:hypothetical protein